MFAVFLVFLVFLAFVTEVLLLFFAFFAISNLFFRNHTAFMHLIFLNALTGKLFRPRSSNASAL
ncbi:MAG: hypothetical protein BA868_02125 [Desulfobacterales bacterium C00003106]|nr:MAG: hypothetical protein BA868_02125 [Desulfobacterales bacterium C00003106]